jgi:hypothetical protein
MLNNLEKYPQNSLEWYNFLSSVAVDYWQDHQTEIRLVLAISVALSIVFYLMLGRIRRHILVDLGHHKWIIK